MDFLKLLALRHWRWQSLQLIKGLQVGKRQCCHGLTCFDCRAGDMRRQHDIGQTAQLGVNDGLIPVHIQSSTRNGLVFQGLHQDGLIDHRATCDVDEIARATQALAMQMR